MKEAAIALMNAGKSKDAEDAFKELIDQGTVDKEIFCRYAILLQQRLSYVDAQHYFLEVLKLDPNSFSALSNLGYLLKTVGKLQESKAYYKKALAINSEHSSLRSNYANLLLSLNEYELSSQEYQKALELSADNLRAYSNLLVSMNYTPHSQEETFLAHRKFAEFSREKAAKKRNYQHQKIRVAYLSGDFKRHSVAYFIEGLLHYHDKEKFSIYCYSDVIKEDIITQRFKDLSDHWRYIGRQNNEEIITSLKKDEIDILVDLGSHTTQRIEIFSKRVAPVQVSYCGYPNTSGLKNMDYRLVDEITDPDGDDYYSEKLIRLPRCFLAFCPPDDAPDIQAPPYIKNNYITFGSFNNFTKVNNQVLKTWRQLLKRVPNSRLLIKSKQFNDVGYAKKVKTFFTDRGIEEERLQIHGFELKLKNHLDWYNKVDIALDTFPYNGTTTTCEALHMGVPVITLAGDRHASRVGKSLLISLGLSSLIASDEAAYRQLAINLAADPQPLITLRSQTRNLLHQSPLCDSKGLTLTLEASYEKMLLKNDCN